MSDYFFTSFEFFILALTVFFHLSLKYSISPLISGTPLSILADFNSAVVGLILVLLLTTHSPSFSSKCLEMVPKFSTIIGMIIIFILPNFFCSLVRSRYLLSFLLSFIFTLWSTGMAKSTTWQVLFLCEVTLNLVFWPGLNYYCYYYFMHLHETK